MRKGAKTRSYALGSKFVLYQLSKAQSKPETGKNKQKKSLFVTEPAGIVNPSQTRRHKKCVNV